MGEDIRTRMVERLRESADCRNNPDEARELREAAVEIDRLDAECERAWESYRIAFEQAVANGQTGGWWRKTLEQIRELVNKRQLPVTNQVYELADAALRSQGIEGDD